MNETLSLKHKQIVLGITGGIAAYKSADLVRRLREAGAIVQVVMTENAKQFITPLTMQAVSGYPIRDDLFDLNAEAAMGHIELARWADVILVAPASADFIARLATGRANDLLTTLCLASSDLVSQTPTVLAPAMNKAMWKNTLTQKNVQELLNNKVHILIPTEGSQACGDVGPGRMQEPIDIVKQVSALFKTEALAGLRVLMTAGPTQEAIDPVRYLTNASSGKMGYALAEAALDAGAAVTLISGPVRLDKSRLRLATTIDVISAQDMFNAVMQHVQHCDIFLAVAAVSDYRFKKPAHHKIHKVAGTLHLDLERTPDSVLEVSKLTKKPFIVGFAAETENLLANAKEKRLRKGVDVMIANQVGEGLGFESDENAVTVLWRNQTKVFSRMTKQKLARQLVSLIAKIYRGKK